MKTDVNPEVYVLNKLNKILKGKNLKELSNQFKVGYSNTAKSGFSLLINKVLGIEGNKKILELEEKGIVIKTIPVNADYIPWESMSFPKFSLVDLIEEKWDGDNEENIDIDNEAVFKNMISQGFIFIPLIKKKVKGKFEKWETWEIGKSVYWKANEDELAIIKKEWEKAKKVVTEGVKIFSVKHGDGKRQMNNLLKASETEIIHIRPHARDSKDIDIPYFKYSKNRIKISWQSFWLNKAFTESIINKK